MNKQDQYPPIIEGHALVKVVRDNLESQVKSLNPYLSFYRWARYEVEIRAKVGAYEMVYHLRADDHESRLSLTHDIQGYVYAFEAIMREVSYALIEYAFQAHGVRITYVNALSIDRVLEAVDEAQEALDASFYDYAE